MYLFSHLIYYSYDCSSKYHTQKVFRKRENWKKVQFITTNTSLDLSILVKASSVACKNDYHNFGHQIGATEMAIRIAQAEGLTQDVIDTIALAMLFHDASHRGIVQRYDEMRAVEAMELVIQEDDTKTIPRAYDSIMSSARDLILATTFSKRGSSLNLLDKIVQDADLAHLGQGHLYWGWSSMGLVDEFGRQEGKILSPITFIRERQEKFVFFLEKIGDGHVYLTLGARNIFLNPIDTLPKVLAFTDAQINYAYQVRKDDITLREFSTEFNKLTS
jgi:hypothetical protein